MTDKLPFTGETLLGVDLGSKVTGIALFTPGRDPFPLLSERIVADREDLIREQIIARFDEEGADHLILGLPLLLDGKESQMTEKVRRFGESLIDQKKLSLFYQDETLTTAEAEERMKKSPRFHFKVDPTQIDSLSASIILEDFLRAHGHNL